MRANHHSLMFICVIICLLMTNMIIATSSYILYPPRKAPDYVANSSSFIPSPSPKNEDNVTHASNVSSLKFPPNRVEWPDLHGHSERFPSASSPSPSFLSAPISKILSKVSSSLQSIPNVLPFTALKKEIKLKDRQKGFYSEYPEYDNKFNYEVEHMRRTSKPIQLKDQLATHQQMNSLPIPQPLVSQTMTSMSVSLNSGEISNRNSNIREDIDNKYQTNRENIDRESSSENESYSQESSQDEDPEKKTKDIDYKNKEMLDKMYKLDHKRYHILDSFDSLESKSYEEIDEEKLSPEIEQLIKQSQEPLRNSLLNPPLGSQVKDKDKVIEHFMKSKALMKHPNLDDILHQENHIQDKYNQVKYQHENNLRQNRHPSDLYPLHVPSSVSMPDITTHSKHGIDSPSMSGDLLTSSLDSLNKNLLPVDHKSSHSVNREVKMLLSPYYTRDVKVSLEKLNPHNFDSQPSPLSSFSEYPTAFKEYNPFYYSSDNSLPVFGEKPIFGVNHDHSNNQYTALEGHTVLDDPDDKTASASEDSSALNFLEAQDIIRYLKERKIEYVFHPLEESPEFKEIQRLVPSDMFKKLNRHLGLNILEKKRRKKRAESHHKYFKDLIEGRDFPAESTRLTSFTSLWSTPFFFLK